MSAIKIKLSKGKPIITEVDPESATKPTPKRRRRDNFANDSDDDYVEEEPVLKSVVSSARNKRRSSIGVAAKVAVADDPSDPEESPNNAEDIVSGSEDDQDYKHASITKGKKAVKQSKTRSSKQRIVSDDDDFDDERSDAGGSSHLQASQDSRPSPEKHKARGVLSFKGKVDRDRVEKKIVARDQRKAIPVAGTSQPQTRMDGLREEPPNKKKRVAPPLPKRISELNEPATSISSLLPSRPVQSRGHIGSADYDLTDKDALQSLFQSAKKPATPKREQHEKMRLEAKKAREEAARKDTFDLMAGSEKIKAFEFQLEARQAIHPPQILLAPLFRWEQLSTSSRAR